MLYCSLQNCKKFDKKQLFFEYTTVANFAIFSKVETFLRHYLISSRMNRKHLSTLDCYWYNVYSWHVCLKILMRTKPYRRIFKWTVDDCHAVQSVNKASKNFNNRYTYFGIIIKTNIKLHIVFKHFVDHF